MTVLRNHVFPLAITALTPVHIGTGARLAANIDYYVDGETTYVVDSDVALDLVVQDWQAGRESPEAMLRRHEAELAEEQAKISDSAARLRQRVEQFDANPPRTQREQDRQADRLRDESARLRERHSRLAQRRANPPSPDDALLPDELINGSTLNQLVEANLLPIARLRERATSGGRPLVRYVFQGRPASPDLYEQIKDVADRPYLPGSSLKGAIRSALAWHHAGSLPDAVVQQFGNSAKQAAKPIEERLFHGSAHRAMNATLRDVMRALHLGDSGPAAAPPELLSVAVFQSKSQRNVRLAVEAIPAETTLRATLQVERYPFESPVARQAITFDGWQERLAPEALAAACCARAADIIAGEQAFFARFAEAAEIARFYTDLSARLAGLPPRAFLLPVGWGAGWRSKTLDTRLRASPAREQTFATAVQRFSLKKHKSSSFRPGDSFPDTRKVALHGDRPWRPLGWLQIAIGEEQR